MSFRAGFRFVPISSDRTAQGNEAMSARIEQPFVISTAIQIVKCLAGVTVAAANPQQLVVLGDQPFETFFVRPMHHPHDVRQNATQRDDTVGVRSYLRKAIVVKPTGYGALFPSHFMRAGRALPPRLREHLEGRQYLCLMNRRGNQVQLEGPKRP